MREEEDKEKKKKEPQVIFQLPDTLSLGILTAKIHAHLQNFIEPGHGFRYHLKKGLKENLPQLDLGSRNSWRIFKVILRNTLNTTTETTLTQSTTLPHHTQAPQPGLSDKDESETEHFATSQRKPTLTPAPTSVPTPSHSPTITCATTHNQKKHSQTVTTATSKTTTNTVNQTNNNISTP